MNTVTEGLQSLRKTLEIHIPVAHRIPPEALGTGIPTGVDKEDFGAELGSGVDSVVHLVRRDLDFWTDSRYNPRAVAAGLRQEQTPSQVTVHGLNGSVEPAEHKPQMHFLGGYGLAGIKHSQRSRRIHAGTKGQGGSVP